MSRVENMFGPRESWGDGKERERVAALAVGGQKRGGGDQKPGAPKAERIPKTKVAVAPAGGGKVAGAAKGRKDNPSVACGDSSPKRGAKGCGAGAREAKAAGFRRGNAPWGGLAGFVSIRCGGCGKVVNTCLHERTPVFRCKGCGHETSLERVSNIHMKCGRCGFTGKYRTNRVEEEIVMECLNCSENVPMKKVRRGNYVPEAEV